MLIFPLVLSAGVCGGSARMEKSRPKSVSGTTPSTPLHKRKQKRGKHHTVYHHEKGSAENIHIYPGYSKSRTDSVDDYKKKLHSRFLPCE
ncbi:hypothetical protein Y032_0083g1637 [Ancylostoma ceylanicum]|uniref:Secreted protein n=1 Tax=Ancylostoma ceylanicum TaxID=53326 RepID=A0A016TRB6_9BILA|nr:hypothetical protein Y032_0083g1637 [Ancylostoma ceylanicum]